MTGTPIRDADVSVLTLPREETTSVPRKRKTSAFWLGSVALITAVPAGIFWISLIQSAPLEVVTAPVRIVGRSLPPSALTASGYVVAQRQASVASKGTGRLEFLAVGVGSSVRTGEIIARVQQDDVQAIQHQARARLEVAKAALTNAQAELRDAQLSYVRAKSLLPNQFVSQAEFDSTANRLRRAEATVRSSSAAITAAEADVQTADVMLENTVIRAPFDGTVLKKFAEVGEVVAPMAGSASSRGAVVLIADMGSLAVETEISETSIARIARGQSADVTFDAAPGRRYGGTVEQIVPTADRSKGTVLAKVRLLDIDERILPEMSAKVSFHASEPPDTSLPPRFMVPVNALTVKDGRTVLYVVEKGIAREVPVEEAAKHGAETEVHGSLTSETRVIREPPPSLASGSRVHIKAAP